MDILIPILFIIAMIYSEVNKKKKENADMDLSDLMSFDDFVDNKPSNIPSSYSNVPSYSPPSRGRKRSTSGSNKQKKSKPPKLTVPPPCPVENTNQKKRGTDSLAMDWGNPNLKKSSTKKRMTMKLTKEELVKSFIFSEVLRRYDINRIYERIPSIPSVTRDE